MKKNAINMLVPLLGSAGLGACATTATTEPERVICRPAAASALVGKAALDDTAIRKATGSSIIRRIAPEDATTKDYREERVTVTIADGQIIAATCG